MSTALPEDSSPPIDVRVERGAPDDTELAAVAAVLQAVVAAAGEGAPRLPAAGPRQSRWLESRRSLRSDLPSRWG